ncbi:MAG: hypothetical protein ABIJ95_10740, partial [Pseudomonadota bacterium]
MRKGVQGGLGAHQNLQLGEDGGDDAPCPAQGLHKALPETGPPGVPQSGGLPGQVPQGLHQGGRWRVLALLAALSLDKQAALFPDLP